MSTHRPSAPGPRSHVDRRGSCPSVQEWKHRRPRRHSPHCFRHMNSANPTAFLIEHVRGRTVPGKRPCKKEMESLLANILKQYFDWVGANLLAASASMEEKEKISFIRKRIQFLTANVSIPFSGFGILRNHGDRQIDPSEIKSLWSEDDFKLARSACAVQIDELNAIAILAHEAFDGFPSSQQSSLAAGKAWRTCKQLEKELETLEWLNAYLTQAGAASAVSGQTPTSIDLYGRGLNGVGWS